MDFHNLRPAFVLAFNYTMRMEDKKKNIIKSKLFTCRLFLHFDYVFFLLLFIIFITFVFAVVVADRFEW